MTNELESLIEEMIKEDGPSALVITEELEPIDGPHGIFYPPTFAGPEETKITKIVYDREVGSSGQAGAFQNSVLVDTVESQANRMEGLFEKEEYKHLITQIKFKVKQKSGQEISLSLVDLSHRIADAIVRASTLWEKAKKAIEELGGVKSGTHDAGPLARLAPTSLLFGFWDSRETGVKWPRIVRSEIRAYNVMVLTRAGQFTPALPRKVGPEKELTVYEGIEGLKEALEAEGIKEDKDKRKFLSDEGLGSVLIHGEKTFQVGSEQIQDVLPGGCVLMENGKIMRTTVIHLPLIRLLEEKSGNSEKLRKYILLLALIAATAPQEYYLRQGCFLRRKSIQTGLVYKYGESKDKELNHKHIVELAKEYAKDFVSAKESHEVKNWGHLVESFKRREEKRKEGKRRKE